MENSKQIEPGNVLKFYLEKYSITIETIADIIGCNKSLIIDIIENKTTIPNNLIIEFAFLFNTNIMFWKKLNTNFKNKE
jgi:plasmid maintenance system antidote protein VapI